MNTNLQNAFTLSRSEYRPSGDDKKIIELANGGKFILAYTQDVHCQFTDAVIAVEEYIVSVHDSLKEAKRYLDQESFREFYIVEPPAQTETSALTGADPCAPF